MCVFCVSVGVGCHRISEFRVAVGGLEADVEVDAEDDEGDDLEDDKDLSSSWRER